MKKRDFLAGFCCGAFVARAAGLDLSKVYHIFAVALVVLVLISLWEWIKNTLTINGHTGKNAIMKRLHEHTNNLVIPGSRSENKFSAD